MTPEQLLEIQSILARAADADAEQAFVDAVREFTEEEQEQLWEGFYVAREEAAPNSP